jgi:hypothetical protein
MKLAMKPDEIVLFRSFLECCQTFLEFGSGGSTVFAATLVSKEIISVDSSQAWQDQVRDYCTTRNTPVLPRLVHCDVGELKGWGYPKDTSRKANWQRYHSGIWDEIDGKVPDFFLVDGRFRVASFMQIMLHGSPEAPVAIHDFGIRPKYQIVKKVAREIARSENLSIFVRRKDSDRNLISDILKSHAFDPD